MYLQNENSLFHSFHILWHFGKGRLVLMHNSVWLGGILNKDRENSLPSERRHRRPEGAFDKFRLHSCPKFPRDLLRIFPIAASLEPRYISLQPLALDRPHSCSFRIMGIKKIERPAPCRKACFVAEGVVLGTIVFNFTSFCRILFWVYSHTHDSAIRYSAKTERRTRNHYKMLFVQQEKKPSSKKIKNTVPKPYSINSQKSNWLCVIKKKS